jgi:RIO-like serine/threonine protein kinase
MGDTDGVPHLIEIENDRLTRSYLPGEPMHHARPSDPDYFIAAAKLLRKLHQLGMVHNDLAKEPNLLVRDDGSPAFIDFQIAWLAPQRGRLFRILAYEDLRHLLKHKRSYCPQYLTRRELSILDNPSLLSRTFMSTAKPVYLFVTRRVLGWAERDGAEERGDQS